MSTVSFPSLSFVLLLTMVACSEKAGVQGSQGTTPELSKLDSIRVAGFVEAAGITWMGWPNKVKDALDGLQGVEDVQVDLEDDRFDVTYNPSVVTLDALLEAIRKLDYKPELVKSKEGHEGTEVAQVNASELPKDLADLFAKARESGKTVLLQFSGPGWPPCKRMDAVTYPHQDVKNELEKHWITARFDVSESKPVATLFGVSAIPVAVAVTGEGKVLGRILGFVEPERFEKELEAIRGNR